MTFTHNSVLFHECINALNIRKDALIVDCTAGLGGHSQGILERGGRLICIDRDPQAIARLRQKFAGNSDVTIIHGNFFDCKEILAKQGVTCVSGILVDLGVSSMQLDDHSRGFSFHHDAKLDMRMESAGKTAADVVNTMDELTLGDILKRFADEPFHRRIAKAIAAARSENPITTTLQLAHIVRDAVPAAARRDGHPARRTFQALRIYINGEIDRLPDALDDLFDLLAPKDRLACISFHSLEDRIVKHSFAKHCKGCQCPPNCPQCLCGVTPRGRKVGKPRTASPAEIAENPRARSAKLRVIEKLI
ncbi:MAG: 16S rRNA (cytosine(1402)-N(4))-methyltransferase RsmH [Oscillospiraceae bacterium]|nr:16S rRNA (cytosine(1402)-N(4))-methyltransferase RsmH [Oscillospiraceae bacterium]